MSVQALFSAFKVRGLTPSEKLVLLVLADHADDKMQCWPSQHRLAEYTDMSVRTIYSAIQRLIGRGLVQKSSRFRADGTRSSDMFTLIFDTEKPEQPAKSADGTTGNIFRYPRQKTTSATGKICRAEPTIRTNHRTLEDLNLVLKEEVSFDQPPRQRIDPEVARREFASLTKSLGRGKALPKPIGRSNSR